MNASEANQQQMEMQLKKFGEARKYYQDQYDMKLDDYKSISLLLVLVCWFFV